MADLGSTQDDDDMLLACSIKSGTHWRLSWIQHGRLCWKSTVAETGDKSTTKSTVAVHGRLCCRFWQQIDNNLKSTVCRSQLCRPDVERSFDFVASVYRALCSICASSVKPNMLQQTNMLIQSACVSFACSVGRITVRCDICWKNWQS